MDWKGETVKDTDFANAAYHIGFETVALTGPRDLAPSLEIRGCSSLFAHLINVSNHGRRLGIRSGVRPGWSDTIKLMDKTTQTDPNNEQSCEDLGAAIDCLFVREKKSDRIVRFENGGRDGLTLDELMVLLSTPSHIRPYPLYLSLVNPIVCVNSGDRPTKRVRT